MSIKDHRVGGGDRCAGCGHSQSRHEVPGFDGECIVEGCRCLDYWPCLPEAPAAAPAAAAVPARVPVTPPKPGTVEQLVALARATGDKRALLVIGRIQAMANELQAIIAAHHARARDEAYRQRLAALPKPAKPPKAPRDPDAPRRSGGAPVIPGGVDCPVCGRNFPTRQGAVLHRRRAHEGYDPRAREELAS